ncbi:MAG: cytochrome P450 [Candidatus Saccharimonadales bacterium]
MNNTILNWDEDNHREIYARQLKETPLYYDPGLKLWAACSYAHCKALLLSPHAYVPQPVIDDSSQLAAKAKLLLRNMARLGNNRQHIASRNAAMMIYKKISSVAADRMLETLLMDADTKTGFDWVEVVAKQLPARLIAKGLGFNDEDSAYLTANLSTLVRIMSPDNADGDVKITNTVVNECYNIARRYVTLNKLSSEKETTALIACNLTGLFIQCYDAGWGLLCNTLLALAADNCKNKFIKNDSVYCNRLVNETLRWDPPVHNTRRVAINDINLGDKTIRAGETILIVLAAANLDGQAFENPGDFDMLRPNNEQHLTFGLGGHNCIARYFNTGMAADVCRFLINNYQNITVLQNEFRYGPKLNVRLIKQLMISIS